MSTEAWIAVITAFVGGGGITALTGYLQSKHRDMQAAKLAERQQPVDQYVKIVEQLESRIDRTEKEHKEEITAIVGKLEECQKHHTSCEREMGFLKGQMHELSKLVMRKSEAVQIDVHGAGDLRTIETTGPSSVANFAPEDSTKILKEDQ